MRREHPTIFPHPSLPIAKSAKSEFRRDEKSSLATPPTCRIRLIFQLQISNSLIMQHECALMYAEAQSGPFMGGSLIEINVGCKVNGGDPNDLAACTSRMHVSTISRTTSDIPIMIYTFFCFANLLFVCR